MALLFRSTVDIDKPSAVESRLQQVDDPGGTLQGKLVAVKCKADHLELHVRGVTAEPWGHGRTLLQRDRKGAWQLVRPPNAVNG